MACLNWLVRESFGPIHPTLFYRKKLLQDELDSGYVSRQQRGGYVKYEEN